MKKIVIVQKDDGRGRQLAQCLESFFPECEILVLKATSSDETKTSTNRKGGRGEKSKNTGGG